MGQTGDDELKPGVHPGVDLLVPGPESRRGGRVRYERRPTGAHLRDDHDRDGPPLPQRTPCCMSGRHFKNALTYISRAIALRRGDSPIRPAASSPGFARTAAGCCVPFLTGAYPAKEDPDPVDYLKKHFRVADCTSTTAIRWRCCMSQVVGRTGKTGRPASSPRLVLPKQGSDGKLEPYISAREVGPSTSPRSPSIGAVDAVTIGRIFHALIQTARSPGMKIVPHRDFPGMVNRNRSHGIASSGSLIPGLPGFPRNGTLPVPTLHPPLVTPAGDCDRTPPSRPAFSCPARSILCNHGHWDSPGPRRSAGPNVAFEISLVTRQLPLLRGGGPASGWPGVSTINRQASGWLTRAGSFIIHRQGGAVFPGTTFFVGADPHADSSPSISILRPGTVCGAALDLLG